MQNKVSIHNNFSAINKPSLNQKKIIGNDRKYIPENFKKIASSYEKQFAQFMVEQMNKTVNKQDPLSTADRYYQDLLTDQRTDKLTNSNGGLGLQDLILDQIYPKKFRNQLALNAYNQRFNSTKNFNQNPYQNVKMGKEKDNE